MKITCIFRYQIDPSQRVEFKQYAENCGRIIPAMVVILSDIFFREQATRNWQYDAYDKEIYVVFNRIAFR